jgi:hypothetical protein
LWRFGTARYLWAAGLGAAGMILTKETYFIHLGSLALAVPCVFILEKISRATPPLEAGRSPNIYVTHVTAFAVAVACFFALEKYLPRLLLFALFGKADWTSITVFIYTIHFVSFVAAALCLYGLEKILPPIAFEFFPQTWTLRDLASVSAVSAALILFFYSGTFMDFPGLKGLYLTYAEWFKTGQDGHGHEKSFWYWTIPWHGKLLKWDINSAGLMTLYEWPALLGLAASFFCVWPRTDRLIRWLAIYGCGALTAYSIVHYKTPWCIVTLIWPFFFVFGEIVKKLADKLGAQIYAIAALVLAASLFVSVRLNFFHFADDKEPYVYVQTFTDIDKLTGPLFKLVAEDPVNYKMTGHILLESYHPLPWVLGDFSSIGYYDDKLWPDKMDADFLIVDTDRIEKTEAALTQEYFTEDFKLRNSMDAAKLYFNCKKFDALFPGRKPGFTPNQPQHPDAGAKQ